MSLRVDQITDGLHRLEESALEARRSFETLADTIVKVVSDQFSYTLSCAVDAGVCNLIKAIGEEYLKTHRRLPGSNRTARLRKKRVSKLLAWLERQEPDPIIGAFPVSKSSPIGFSRTLKTAPENL